MSTPGAELHMKDEFVGLVTNFTEVADLFDSLLSLVKSPRDKATVLRLKFREIKRRLEAIKGWAEDSPEPASEFVTTVLYLRRILSPLLYSLCKCIPDLTEVISFGSGTNSRESSTPLEARHWDDSANSARLLEIAAEFEGALDPFHPVWRKSWPLITYFTPRLKLVHLEEILKVEMANRKHSDGASKISSLFVEDEHLFPKLLSAMVDLNQVAFGGLQNPEKNRPSLLSAFHRITRPEIRKEWARIEWQCVSMWTFLPFVAANQNRIVGSCCTATTDLMKSP
ncbi:hypothetical protein FH972_021729 [Carpinus fangiana]|uniref:Uncharacterized protein n=1 Tax=Carpinus fangiana TaxID=176857 RepID=A0A5N6KQT7_9ROSI|nr:hypothetical protein FH972_021729 [Carpinus fangiana]